MQLRPHQLLQFEFLKSRSVALVNACCGSGKTTVELECLKQQEVKLSVLVIPWLLLTEQFLKYLREEKFQGAHIFQINACGFGTSDREEIRRNLADARKKVVCTTYRSLSLAVDCFEAGRCEVDVSIFDEAHHLNEPRMRVLTERLRRMSKKCFFFTATPSPELRAIAGPENETVYPLAQAIEDGVCNSFDLRVMVVNGQRTPKVRSSKVLGAIAQTFFETHRNRILLKCGLVDGARRSGSCRVWDFTQDEALAIFRETAERWGRPAPEVQLRHLSAKTGQAERHRILEQLDATGEGQVYIICFCNTLTEGVDTKTANMAVLVDGMRSKTAIVQVFGRVQRRPYQEQVPRGIVLLPCFLDAEEYTKAEEVKRHWLLRRDVAEEVLCVVGAMQLYEKDRELIEELLQQHVLDAESVQREALEGGDRKWKEPLTPRLIFDDSLLRLELDSGSFKEELQSVIVRAVADPTFRQEKVKSQVDWLCEHYPVVRPKQLGTLQVLLPGLTRTTATFRSGKFLERLKCNWIAGCGTRITGAQKRRVQHLSWFPEWRRDIERRRGVRQRVEEKVELLCRLWPDDEAPVQRRPKEGFDGGRFLDKIKGNWTSAEVNTKLSQKQKMAIERLPWFKERILKRRRLAPGRPPSNKPKTRMRCKHNPEQYAKRARGLRFLQKALGQRSRADLDEDLEILELLRNVKEQDWICRGRENVSEGEITQQFTLGAVWHREERLAVPSKITFKYPRLCRRLLRMHAEMLGDAELRGPARQYVSSIQVTKNFKSPSHLDTNNSGWSYLVTKGCFTGGRVWVEREDGEERANLNVVQVPKDLNVHNNREGYPKGKEVEGYFLDGRHRLVHFDGRKLHFTEDFEGERYCIIFFCDSRASQCCGAPRQLLKDMGFALPPPEEMPWLCETAMVQRHAAEHVRA